MFHRVLLFCTILCSPLVLSAQQIIKNYQSAPNDSVQIGPSSSDYMPLISAGYTLMLPDSDSIQGVLIFLEDAKFDQQNKQASSLYPFANQVSYAVLSVSTSIPLDFYFLEESLLSAHRQIREVFAKYQLPNRNLFFLGSSLVGHRAMRYLKFIKTHELDFKPAVNGMVLCNFTMDFSRKWHQHQRDIRLNRIDLWEPRFINFMLEQHLGGTALTNAEAYYEFSAYNHSDPSLGNIQHYTDLAICVYVEPALNYRLNEQYRTLYENNTTDMVGFLAELKLQGNTKSELIIIGDAEENDQPKTSASTWAAIDKAALMEWILLHS